MDSANIEKGSVPAVDGYFTWPSDKPQLIGSRCKSCGKHYFPRTFGCANPDCTGGKLEDVLLSTKGTLWSYLIQYYISPPPYHPPDPFVPYAIGLVELPEGIRVVGMLTDCDIDGLKIGMSMELKVEKIYEDEQGNDAVTWKFRPTQG